MMSQLLDHESRRIHFPRVSQVSKLVFYAQSTSAVVSLTRVTEFHKCFNTEAVSVKVREAVAHVCSLLHCFSLRERQSGHTHLTVIDLYIQ